MLSEVNPYGWLNSKNTPHFSLKGYRPGRPLDLALHFTGQDLPRKLKLKHFCQQIEMVLEYANILNQNVLIRDHTHHTFPFHGQENKLSSFDLLSKKFTDNQLFGVPCQISNPILSVRHPLDSFLSSRLRNWHLNYSQDGSFSGYCESLLKLQIYHQELNQSTILRYEDLCVNESLFYEQIKNRLNIENIAIQQTNKFAVTGRSGRYSGDSLELRKRQFKYIDEKTLQDCNEDINYKKLCELNNYEADPFSHDILK